MLKPRKIGVEPCLIYFLKFGFNQLDFWFWTLVKPMPKGFLYHFGSDLLQSNDPLGILVAGCQRFRRRSAPGESCHLPWPEKPPNGSRMKHWKAWSMPGPQIPWLVLVVPLWSLPRSPEDRLTPRITRLFGTPLGRSGAAALLGGTGAALPEVGVGIGWCRPRRLKMDIISYHMSEQTCGFWFRVLVARIGTNSTFYTENFQAKRHQVLQDMAEALPSCQEVLLFQNAPGCTGGISQVFVLVENPID